MMPALLSGVLFSGLPVRAQTSGLGLFAGESDIGAPKIAGSAVYDPKADSYLVTGGGENMWFKSDSFHFVWKKVEADTALSADIAFIGQSAEHHRKAVLMIRQSLDADSAYVDATVHGDGLTSLQFREVQGDVTHEIQTTVVAPRRMRLEKSGDYVYLLLAGPSGVVEPSGCSLRLPFTGSFYVGIGVCAHQLDVSEKVVFSNVQFSTPGKDAAAVRSVIETISVASGDRRRVYHSEQRAAAPNWSHDGTSLFFNEGGKIFRFPLNQGAAVDPEPIDTGFAGKCTDSHGLSPDGTLLAITDRSKTQQPRIYVLPVAGGAPREITVRAPSEFHGWSPDGQTLIFSAGREGKAGIFSAPAAGGQENRLTSVLPGGFDEGPEYSPDGQWVYFYSDRSGHSQIWKMRPDGTALEQVTHDANNNRFPHPSPDGKWVSFLAYAPGVRGAAADRDVALQLFSLTTGETKTLAKIFGGDGSLNSPSWSPDSQKIAYVRYQPK